MSSQRTGLSLTRKTTLTVIVLSLVSIFAELGLRAASIVTKRVRIFQRHPVTGHACRSSLVNVEKRWDAQNTFHYSTDANGFRITAPPEAERAEPPILLVGDSFAFGWCVDDRDSLGYLLADLTRRRVLNLSCIGYGPDVSLALLRWHFEQPDTQTGGAAVLLLCENDFMDILARRKSNRAKPFCTLTDDDFQTRAPELSWVDQALDSSALAYTLLTRLLPPEQRTDVPVSDSPRLMCRILSEIRTLCERNDTELDILFFTLLEGSTLRPGIKNAFFEQCGRENIEVTDITGEIAGSARQGRELLAVDGLHWNRRGNQRVAAIISRGLNPEPSANEGLFVQDHRQRGDTEHDGILAHVSSAPR